MAEQGPAFADDVLKAVDFGGENGAALRSEAVNAAVFVAGESRLRGVDDEVLVHEAFQVVVESAGADLIVALGLARDLLKDAVSVEVFGGERKQDVEHGRREGWGFRCG